LPDEKRGEEGGDDALKSLLPRFLTLTRRGKSLEDRVYIDGTWRLNAMIICPLEETG
jgi:hypothetical protein